MNLTNTLDYLSDLQRKKLEHHTVFSSLTSLPRLQLFMSWHVFAVWDFMSLAKRLQQELSCTQTPWLPPRHPQAARLINEIILEEESDQLSDGSSCSHFELYCRSMQEVGADTRVIDAFIKALKTGTAYNQALKKPGIHPEIHNFVGKTLGTALNEPLEAVLGSFFFGRENVIPAMFSKLLGEWSINEKDAPLFVYYLKRHIELDGDEHGPAMQKIIDDLIGEDPARLKIFRESAEQAIEARFGLWNSLHDAIKGHAIKKAV